MSAPATPAERALLFKALSHPARLLILNLAWECARTGEELAAILNLTPATVSHHLAQLSEVGLVAYQAQGNYRLYRTQQAALAPTLEALVRAPQVATTDDPEARFRQKVLRAFMPHGRLTQIPAQRKKRDVILDFLAREFEPGRDYPEREVNLKLSEYADDFFTLRRELVERGLLTRAAGVYRRVPDESEPGA